jgi:UDP-glucose 4-epimerase
MRILILGSEGFIGNHLVKALKVIGNDIYGCDLFERPFHEAYHYIKVSRLSPQWEEIFSTQVFDVCINAAGSGNVPYSMTHPLMDFEANTLDAIRILDAIKRLNGSCKYLHISSAAVYGNPPSLPVREDMGPTPLSPYGYHKWMSELACKEFYHLHNVKTAILRPFSVYGPGLRKQLIWDLYHKISKGDDLTLFGTGDESRDFVYVEDLARAVKLILDQAPFDNTVYNIASGEETTIRAVSELFRKVIGTSCKISFNNQKREGDPANWRADISRIKELGFNPSFTFEEGLTKTHEWLKWVALEKQ